ncbi:hypothetical protein [Streptomyces sp. NPDC088196]|uniref:hypothetical protein n=1 Tax=Streptomyces sp. NPDC088196 TaxID=3154868 RepID=UPI00345098DE
MSGQLSLPNSSWDIVPLPATATRSELRELERMTRLRLFLVRLEGIVQALALNNAYNIHRLIVQQHIEGADELLARLEESDNPLRKRALERDFESWLNRSEAIANGRY